MTVQTNTAPAAADQTPAPAASPAAPASPDTGAPTNSTDQAAATAAPADPSKPAEGSPATAATTDPAKTEGAPESYAFVAPEGITLSDGVLQAVSEFARAGNMPQEKAQESLNGIITAYQAQAQAEREAVLADWETQTKTDKEIGGDKFEASMASANKAIDQFASPDFRKFLDDTGLGNHPEMARMLSKIGQAISEDSFVGGGDTNDGKPVPIERRMYPNMA